MAAPNGEHPTHSRVKDDDIVPAYLVKGSSLLERRFRRSVLSEGLPTLTRLSAQRLYVTRIKTEDVKINTVSLSVLVLPGMNADYDGDALNGIIILDHQMLASLDELAPRNGVYDTRKPRSISSHIAIPAPVVTTISNYIHRGR